MLYKQKQTVKCIGYKNISFSFFLLFFIITLNSCGYTSKDFYYSGHLPPVRTITITENGNNYDIEAISGHVIVIFKPSISYSQAVKIIKSNKGAIIGQLTGINYYSVFTGKGKENDFINKLKNNNDVLFINLNAVEYPRKIDPQPYVMDNFYTSHGDNVKYALKECGITSKIHTYNVGIKGDEEGRLSWSEIDHDLYSILNFPPKDTPLVINMSFGVGFNDPYIKYWTDEDITDEIKKDYIKQYKGSIKHLISVMSEFSDKDFIIVKSAGNEGLKKLDTEILYSLEKELSGEEIKILKEHFILVGAKDDRDNEYSNTVTNGKYNFLYTSVDISDLKNNNENLYGTSFAAPRVSCFITSAIAEHNITATEALKAIQDINYRNPTQTINQNAINQEVKRIVINKNDTPSNTVNNKTQTNTKNQSVSKNILANTKWQSEYKDIENLYIPLQSTIEFQEDYTVIITDYYKTGAKGIDTTYKYFFDSKFDKWRMYKTLGIEHILKIDEEEAKENALKNGSYYFISISGNKLILTDPFGYKSELSKQ